MTGGAVHTGMKCLVYHGLPLIPRAQVIDLGRDLRQRLGKLGLILLGLSADNLFTQCAELFLLLHRIATFITGHLIVALAQFDEPFLHFGSIEAGKLFFRQCRNLILKGCNALRNLHPHRFMLLLLGCRQVLLPAEIGNTLLQLADLCTPSLEIGVRRKDHLIL